ncbi:alpha-amylase family glycosyl hydrolase [Gloeothece verrucosa]|uniref:Alpha amylase catalytic region n=1 Tax=Gloeothece verrucosa (strain PCC 7822) TaxID=497965 RepID=E0UBQ8_GLOV7|nr:alpha-amylase family glycosyl hydrolase [Gloeothece verrucosa]ADN14002.1 alpha amylase catalytic region [Gloeothece verrucosa PCC 7822]
MNQSLYPSLYQINTRLWFNRLSRELGHPMTLDDIPDKELDRLAALGFEWIYFLSVWQIGEAGRNISRTKPEWLAEYREVLPDLQVEDICGSGFAITGYTLNSKLGDSNALGRLRDRLHQRGLKLILDFVPNHTALDHPWVEEHLDYYIAGTPSQLAQKPNNYIKLDLSGGSEILAFGRDPYFDGWPDTLQLNYGNPSLQAARIEELLHIAQWCDGLRCDMAMLILPDIFQKTWGIEMEPFWSKAIQKVHQQYPAFVFMAEVYWDMEWRLQQEGFDYTYDKRLYDHLRYGVPRPVREHFWANLDYQPKSVRFLENHDEPRTAKTFAPDVHQAAAIISFLCPGLRFLHQGQLEGWQTKVTVHLCRGPEEETDPTLETFYSQLLACLRLDIFRNGTWQLLECQPAWETNWTWDCFIAFAWTAQNGQRAMVVVNYAANQSQCYVKLPWSDLAGKRFELKDLMNPVSYDVYGDNLLSTGFYLDLSAWGYHVFQIVESI